MTSSPDEVLGEKQKQAAAARAAKDFDLWHKWHTHGRTPEHLEPLLDAYAPLIARKTQEWTGSVLIPRSVMEGEITKHVITAFQTYDPKRGAALNTHVQHRIQKAKRFMVQHQNVTYIPEPQAYQIGNIQRAHNALSQDLGRDPTTQEIADHIGLPVRQVSRIQKSIHADIPGSSLETDPVPRLGPREQEVLALLPGILSVEEKQVFDLIYHPDPKKRMTSTSDIASKIGKNPSQVSRLKTSIIQKTKQYL